MKKTTTTTTNNNIKTTTTASNNNDPNPKTLPLEKIRLIKDSQQRFIEYDKRITELRELIEMLGRTRIQFAKEILDCQHERHNLYTRERYQRAKRDRKL